MPVQVRVMLGVGVKREGVKTQLLSFSERFLFSDGITLDELELDTYSTFSFVLP